jgi:hypothetical protein
MAMLVKESLIQSGVGRERAFGSFLGARNEQRIVIRNGWLFGLLGRD